MKDDADEDIAKYDGWFTAVILLLHYWVSAAASDAGDELELCGFKGVIS